jgi:DNA-binding beta-propeller fold protein YncE
MMRHRATLAGFLIGLLLGATGCAGSVEIGSREGDEIVFSRDVLPLLRASFVPLLTQDSGLDARTWGTLMEGSEQGEVIIPFDADRSLLIELAERAGSDGPSAQEIALVRKWIDAGARNDAGAVPHADADRLLYVCNQGAATISVIDMDANLVTRTVDLRDFGFSGNARPHHVAVAPDGAAWYVSLIGENTILKFDRSNQLVGRASFEVPGMLAMDPSSERLYVGRSMSAVNPPQRIGTLEPDGIEVEEMDVEEMDVEEIDVFYSRPHALTVTPNGRHAYSASLGENRLASIDGATFDVEIVDLPGPHHGLVQFAVAPDGKTMIAGGEMSGEVLFFDLEKPMSPRVVASIQVGGSPWHPTYLPDGTRVFVPRKQADAVSIIDPASQAETGVVSGSGIAQPHGSAVRSDGRYVYVSSNNLNAGYTPRYHHEGDPNGAVVVIDAESLQIVKVIEVENYPTGIATRPAY